MWVIEPVNNLYIRIKNLWTGAYLRINNGVLEMDKNIQPGWWDAMWEPEPVGKNQSFALGNHYTQPYLNMASGKLDANTTGPGSMNSAYWMLNGYTRPGTNLLAFQWMRANSEAIADKPLNQICLPGAHDSGTYNLTSTYCRDVNDPFAPDTDNQKRGLSFLGGLDYSGWAMAQDKTVLQQLTDGIRFIDLCVSGDKSGNLKACLGLYGVSLQTILNDIASFAQNNPREIVVVELQHLCT